MLLVSCGCHAYELTIGHPWTMGSAQTMSVRACQHYHLNASTVGAKWMEALRCWWPMPINNPYGSPGTTTQTRAAHLHTWHASAVHTLPAK